MRVLITGANGQLGSEIREFAANYKKLDIVLDEFSLKYPSWEVVKINMDKNKNIAEAFSVGSVPTILAFAKKVNYFSFTGFIDLSDLEKSVVK